jgi:hypothetical protein
MDFKDFKTRQYSPKISLSADISELKLAIAGA